MMSAANVYLWGLRCISKERYSAYILISASAVTCYHLISAIASRSFSVASGLPLLAGYTAHTFFEHRLQRPRSRSLHYCVLLSAALLSLGDIAHLIKTNIVADPDEMSSVHLAVTHFFLAFLVVSETEYCFTRAENEDPTPYPGAFIPPPANMILYRYGRMHDDQEPSDAVVWRGVAIDVAICVLWQFAAWQFTSLLQAWLNPDFQPRAGLIFRPLTTSFGFEVIWTSNVAVGGLLQAIMMRSVRILISFIFAYVIDFVQWLKQL